MHDRPLYRALAQELFSVGVRHVFGVMGEDTASLTAAVTERGITYMGARHEAAAVAMADGYAWASGALGVCMVTRGPGLMNAATALRTAVQGRRRVLVVTGDMPTGGDRRFDYKAIDQAPLAAALGARLFGVDAAGDGLPQLAAALACAWAGQPAVLAVAADVFAHPVSSGPLVASVAPAPAAPEPIAEVDLARISDAVAASRLPLLLAGRGASGADAVATLGELATHTGALLGTTLLAKDVFRGHPHDLGVVGSFASDAAAEVLGGVDFVASFGASLTPFTTAQRTLFADAIVAQIDRDPERIGATFPVDIGVTADAAGAAAALLGHMAAAPPRLLDPDVLARLRGPLFCGVDESRPGELDPRALAAALDERLAPERVVILDSGRFMTSPARFIRVAGPDRFRLTADAGSIALGLGVALGAAVARPQLPHVLFIGDGGLSMSLGDLESAARHDIALTVVVMNDRAYGAEMTHLQSDGLSSAHAALPEIDFAAVARALGLEAARITSLDELEPVLARTSRRGPRLIDCRIRSDLTTARLRWPAPTPVVRRAEDPISLPKR